MSVAVSKKAKKERKLQSDCEMSAFDHREFIVVLLKSYWYLFCYLPTSLEKYASLERLKRPTIVKLIVKLNRCDLQHCRYKIAYFNIMYILKLFKYCYYYY